MMDYKDLLGIRYTPHGRTKGEGFDCYGLAIEVLRRNGINLRDVWSEKSLESQKFVLIEKAEENCLVSIIFCGKQSHIGVYIGEGLMIHTTPSTGVIIEPITHYKGKIKGFYNVHD